MYSEMNVFSCRSMCLAYDLIGRRLNIIEIIQTLCIYLPRGSENSFACYERIVPVCLSRYGPVVERHKQLSEMVARKANFRIYYY